ncbi:copper resistance protein CopC (plasmid) [Rhodococcus sp. SGAir0479]|nr:copper resistance protein CopC [Rhodococcus sp. SGAir0479]
MSVRRVVGLLIAVGAMFLIGSGVAQAHSALISSSPAADGVLDTSPAGVELTFNQNIQDQFANVTVTDPSGKQVGDRAPSVRGDRVLLSVTAELPAGEYTVGYRVISEDGHPISGTYKFTVVGAATGSSAADENPMVSSAAPAPTDATTSAGEETDGSSMVLPILGGIVAVLFVAGLVVILRGERKKNN